MEFGICVASRPADLGYVVEAESLGYRHCWMADSQMIWSDVYAMLALVADRTTTMAIGTGVAVAGVRPAPVTAAALATINQLAPGRTFCGIGTGNTAMRIMGHKPMRIAEFDRYLTELASLLSGEEATIDWHGEQTPIRHLMPDHGFVAFEPRVPVYVSAFGPRSMELAARHGDGLITSAPPEPDMIAGIRSGIEMMGAAAGRELTRANFPIATLTTMVVLERGEPIDSERSRRECGAFAIAGVHYAYDQYRQFGRRPPVHMQAFWDDYVALVEDTPAERRHQRVHLGHNCWVLPEEERFVTADLIERSCLVGTADQLVERIGALDDAGLDQIVLLPPLAEKEKVIRDVATHVMGPLSGR
jgi:alkanesulfonate monooxygenase SsuD/methylene tetrahydromethanopterin reductase-like flavin-dependent oxidoreductase (luciferase family)